MNVAPKENIRMALDAIWSHRFRSGLTILGIIIGITTVVTVSSLLTGLRAGVVTFFDELGPDNIFIFKTSGDPHQTFEQLKERRRRPIKKSYADLIMRWSSTVRDVSVALFIPPVSNGSPIAAKVPGFETDNLSIVATDANAIELSPHEFDQGRYFTAEEDARRMHVAVLGYDIAQALYPDGNAIGRTFMLDGAEFTVIGVAAKAKGGFFGENSADTQITIPLGTGESRYPEIERYMITARAKSGMRKDAYEEVEDILRKARRLKPGTPDDFNISTPDQIIQQFDKITGLIGLIAIAISGLGLLVGGIGVMNIMLVSVTERTREIGVRKALGARRFDIVSQFIAEAMALTGVGGIAGIVFALGITLLVGLLVPSIKTSVPTWAVATAFLVSMAIGLFFGVWPAVKAASLDPVDALRYE